jgi:hypothetical protein
MSSVDHTIWRLSWPSMEDIQATVRGKLLVFSFFAATARSSLSKKRNYSDPPDQLSELLRSTIPISESSPPLFSTRSIIHQVFTQQNEIKKLTLKQDLFVRPLGGVEVQERRVVPYSTNKNSRVPSLTLAPFPYIILCQFRIVFDAMPFYCR